MQISRETAIISITALRHFNKKLQDDLKDLKKYHYGQSSINSINNFIDLTKKAYKELQNQTGNKTPLEIKENKHD